MNEHSQAFIFPGQGSQTVGMLAEYAKLSSIFTDTFSESSESLGYDLWQLIQEGPEETLSLTKNTQPAMLTASVALWRLWRDRGGRLPIAMAGHSLGEWSALVCAGVLELQDAVRLVHLRGRYMQEAVPLGQGAMAAIIGLDDNAIINVCQQVDTYVAAVNFNAPGQVVIAGEKAAVETASSKCKELGAKRALLLPVSAPFHTKLMKPAADKLAMDIDKVTFNSPKFPIVHNVTADTEADEAVIKALMIEQIYTPVRWVECAQRLIALGADSAIECGPGKVLSGLMRRIDKSVSVLAIESISGFELALNG